MMGTEQKMGHPRRFGSDVELTQAMSDYLVYAEEHGRFPSIAGFCVFAKMTKDTFYQNRNYYPDAYKMARLMLEDAVLSLNEKLTTRAIFYLKNAFDYKDVTDQRMLTPDPVDALQLDNLSTDELLKFQELLKKASDPQDDAKPK